MWVAMSKSGSRSQVGREKLPTRGVESRLRKRGSCVEPLRRLASQDVE